MDDGVSAVPQVSQGLNLYPNYPNLFNPSTTISYSLEKDGHVELAVYSVRLVGQNKAAMQKMVLFK